MPSRSASETTGQRYLYPVAQGLPSFPVIFVISVTLVVSISTLECSVIGLTTACDPLVELARCIQRGCS